MDTKPTGPRATSGLELFTWGTPSGCKITIFLEELKAAYGLEYTYVGVDLFAGVQKEAWYTALHPGGVIPCLIDHDHGGLTIMEGQAILQYLCRAYDRDAVFHYRSDPEQADCEQWVSFAQGALGPRVGEANFFYRFGQTKDLFALNRAVTNLAQHYSILEKRLEGRTYLVGDKYTVADIATFALVEGAPIGGIELSPYPNISRWVEHIAGHAAAEKGQQIPQRFPFMGSAYHESMKTDPEFRAREQALKDVLAEARQQFGQSG